MKRVKKELHIRSKYRAKCSRKKYNSYKGDVGKIAPNVLDRDFAADAPYRKIATDITEFKVGEKKLYLSPFQDIFTSKIISYRIGTSPNMTLVIDGLNEALSKIGDTVKVLFHSDQGFHYQNPAYRSLLNNAGCIQSMSRKGTCLDNAMIESFFGILKSEIFDKVKFDTLEELEYEIIRYISYYNECRMKTRLKMSPVEYRKMYNVESISLAPATT